VAAALGVAAVLGWVGPGIMIRCVSCRIVTTATQRIVDGETLSVVMSYKALLGRFTPPVRVVIDEAAFGNTERVVRFQSQHSEVSLDLGRPRRGVYEAIDIQIESSWPLNLRTCRRQVACTLRVIVWPLPIKPARWPELKATPDSSPRLHTAALRVGDDGDPLAVRPYRRGDALRQVHWAQSARHDRLIVRERQANDPPAASIFVHTSRTHYADVAELDQTLGLAAAMIQRWTQQGICVRLTPGHAQAVSSFMSQPLMDALAQVQMSSHAAGATSGAYTVVLPGAASGSVS